MSGIGDLWSAAETQRSFWGGWRAAGRSGWIGLPGIVGWGPLRRIAAAGLVMAVALCMSWIPIQDPALRTAGPGDGFVSGGAARLLAGQGHGEPGCGAAVRAGLRLHGAFAVPRAVCLPVLPAGHRLLSSGLPAGPRGHRLRLLAFRHEAVEEPTWSRRVGCLAGPGVPPVPRLFAVITPARPSAGAVAPADPGGAAGRGQSLGFFSGSPVSTCIAAGADGPPPGAGTGIAGRWCGAFSGSGQFGCGDRASLPGRPSRYHLIQLVCDQCGTEMALVFYDQGDRPCVNCPDGQMKVRL